MRKIRKYSIFPIFFLLIDIFGYYSNNLIPKSLNADTLSANLARILTQPEKIEPILQNYPFPQLTPAITIAEGFEAYDGNLGDKIGSFHWGIDFVQKEANIFYPSLFIPCTME